MSLQNMAWLTQGPMAAADLELDVDSMEQEVAAETDPWQFVGPPTTTTTTATTDEEEGAKSGREPPPPPEVLMEEVLHTESIGSYPTGYKESNEAVPSGANDETSTNQHSTKSISSVASVRKRSGTNVNSGDCEGKHPVSHTSKQNPKGVRKESGSDGESQSSKGVRQTSSTSFGTIKVDTTILGCTEARSYIVTNRTTSRDLVAIVLADHNAIYEDQSLFHLVLEKNSKRLGFGGTQKTVPLQDSSLPLQLQFRHNRVEARFCLKLKPSAGVVTVKGAFDKEHPEDVTSSRVIVAKTTMCRDLVSLVLRSHNTIVDSNRYVLLQEDKNSKATKEMKADDKLLESARSQGDPGGATFLLRTKMIPQRTKMRRRHSLDSTEGLRRGRQAAKRDGVSGDEEAVVVGSRPAGRRSLIPRIKRGSSTGSVNQATDAQTSNNHPSSIHTPAAGAPSSGRHDGGKAPLGGATDRETTMTKLKDSLSKLREHLDSLQRRKTLTSSVDMPDTKGSASGISTVTSAVPSMSDRVLHEPHGDGPRRTSGSSPELSSPTDDHIHLSIHVPESTLPPHNFLDGPSTTNGSVRSSGTSGDGVAGGADDDTGDTSLNESDGGSTSARYPDSAYASDMTSHTSAKSYTDHSGAPGGAEGDVSSGGGVWAGTRRRVRRSSYTSSDQSSPENQPGPRAAVQLRKTQSLYELQQRPPQVDNTPPSGLTSSRIRSASHAQARGRIVRRNLSTAVNNSLSGSEDQLTTWARRKQYDNRRRAISGSAPGAGPDGSADAVVRRTQSFQEFKTDMVIAGRPTSADYDTRRPQQQTGGAPARAGGHVGGVKMRRTLPKVPAGAAVDIEERRKRMSAEILRLARVSVPSTRSEMQQAFGRSGGGSMHSSPRGSEAGSSEYGAAGVMLRQARREPTDPATPIGGSCTAQLPAPKPQYRTTTTTTTTTTVAHNSPRHAASDSESVRNTHHHHNHEPGVYERKATDLGSRAKEGGAESSQEALQRIINDLRHAANQPFEGSTSSRAGSRSSVASSSVREYDPSWEGQSDRGPVPYRQLARWGVLEPSDVQHPRHLQENGELGPSEEEEEGEEEDEEEDEGNDHGYRQQYRRRDDREDREEEEEEELREVHLSLQQEQQQQHQEESDQPESVYLDSRASDSSSRFSGRSVQSELRVEHPTIHRVLQSCRLLRATLQRLDIFTEFGFDVFEATYYDKPEGSGGDGGAGGGSGSERRGMRPVLRTPSGRRPVLGRRRGAFVPVTPVGPADAGPPHSLVAVDNVVDGSPADRCGALQEGDYIIEVNGLYVVDADVARVQAELSEAGNTLDLVLARPNDLCDDRLEDDLDGGYPGSANKELERLKLKYDALKQDAERCQDTIADLKLELQDRERHLGQLESDLGMRQEQFVELERALQLKDEEAAEWKYEANHRNVELARLKYETKQKDDRIAQLRRLLIQQTELMQLHQQDRSSEGGDQDRPEEHVSAV